MFGSFAMLSKKELLIFNHIKDISIFFHLYSRSSREEKKEQQQQQQRLKIFTRP